MSPQQARRATVLRGVAAELQRLGVSGVAVELEVLLSEDGAGLAAGEQFLAYMLETAAAWAQVSDARRAAVRERLLSAVKGAERAQAEAAVERATAEAGERLRAGSLEQGKRMSLALARELEAHPAGLLQAELSGFLRDRLGLYVRRATAAVCEELGGHVAALRSVQLQRVAGGPKDPPGGADAALHLMHGELGVVVEEARAIADRAMSEQLQDCALSTSLPGLGESRFKRRLTQELPPRVTEAAQQSGARVADRLTAQVGRLIAELDRHCAAHQQMALGFLSAQSAPLSELADDLRQRLDATA